MYNSLFQNIVNRILLRIQNTRFANVISGSLFFAQIDNIALFLLLATLVLCVFSQTGTIGVCISLFIFTIVLKLLFKKDEQLPKNTLVDVFVILFLAFSFLSLMGSSLLILSFKGFLKTLLYIAFYFSFNYWLRDNKNKLILIFIALGLLISFESAVGILQNFCHIEAISGWQDYAGLNPNEVISRSYGTLKPYNPNLFAGYLLCGLPLFLNFASLNLLNNNKKRTGIFLALILLNVVAIILTGCRGAYLALITFFLMGGYLLVYYINNYLGGFSNMKKRYKTILYSSLGIFGAFVLLNPAIYKRILSIFAFRADSSISFRLNVYKSSFQMFLDNPLIGIGLGNQNFRETYGLYMMTGYDALGAYSVLLETAVETGILGLLAFLGILISAVFYSTKFLKGENDKKTKLLIFSMLVLLALLMTHGLIDTIFYRPQVQIVFWIALATINVFSLRISKPHQS